MKENGLFTWLVRAKSLPLHRHLWKKLEDEETLVNVADIRKQNIDVALRRARNDYKAKKRNLGNDDDDDDDD